MMNTVRDVYSWNCVIAESVGRKEAGDLVGYESGYEGGA